MLDPFISATLSLRKPSSKTRNSADVFLQVTCKSVSAHHTCCFLPRVKGHAYFPDVLKTHPYIFSPHFLFPWLVSIIQALPLSWNFPCSCILTCWLFLCSCSVVQRFWFVHAAQMLIWAPNLQFSGLSWFFYPSRKLLPTSLTQCSGCLSLCSLAIATGNIAGGCCLIQRVLREKLGLQQSSGEWQGQICLFKSWGLLVSQRICSAREYLCWCYPIIIFLLTLWELNFNWAVTRGFQKASDMYAYTKIHILCVCLYVDTYIALV